MTKRPAIFETVFETARAVMANPSWVCIDAGEPMDKLVETVKLTPPQKPWGHPKLSDYSNVEHTVLHDLIGNSINYCYWYGRHDVRPGGACANDMWEMLGDSFRRTMSPFGSDASLAIGKVIAKSILEKLYHGMVVKHYPLLPERRKHLDEIVSPLVGDMMDFPNMVINDTDCKDCPSHLDELMTIMLNRYPGYAADPLLKRASLFFMYLYNRFGWFKDSIWMLPCPSDYQIPKVLHAMGILQYHPALEGLINDGCIIHKNGAMEAEIRSATILAVDQIATKAGKTSADIDYPLWLVRKQYPQPHHLTLTTDY